MPAKGGSWVTDLNTGTANRQRMPVKRMLFRTDLLNGSFGVVALPDIEVVSCPFRDREVRNTGIHNAITLGRKILFIIPPEEILSLIHSMMVVTSPMGVQAPPALAAMMMILPKSIVLFVRSAVSG